jgi:tetratricopeptide (TPR) repeat protein
MKDIFSIQREVALAIAAVLNTALSKKESQQLDYLPTVDLQAYDHYMRGKLLLENRTAADTLQAREHFQEAIRLDKLFADAYAGLANTYLLASFRGYEDPVQMLWQAKKYIDSAVGLDSFSGETQASLGYWYFQTFDWHAAEITYRRAISLNANQSNVYLWLAILLQAKGETEEAMEIYNKGTEINPMWYYLLKNKVMALVSMNKKEEAIALQQTLIEKTAQDKQHQAKRYEELSRLYWSFNEKENALQAAVQSGDAALIQYYKTGDHSLLEKRTDEYYTGLKLQGGYISQFWMGIDYAYAGARDKAINCFNSAVALKEAGISLLLIRDFGYFNIKYLNMALVNRKVKQLINF